MAGLDTQPSATAYDLEELVTQAWVGKIRVPHFQRDFRWASKDVVRLFDSIARGYPIGSLLLWVRPSPAERVRLGKLTFEAEEAGEALWVVDGQQRITSLANALHPDGGQIDPFRVHYDLAERKFIPTPRLPEPHQVPLPLLFDLQKLLNWFAGPGQDVVDYLNEATDIAKKLRQFKVPAYLVKQRDEAVLKDIFDRMNNFGKRLSRAEIFSALFAESEGDSDNRWSLSRISERLSADTGFGTIDNSTVLHCILVRRGPDLTRDPRTEFEDGRRRAHPEFPGEDEETASLEGANAMERAIRFLQHDAGVPHFAFLGYRALLVALTRFFAHFPEPQERHRELLCRAYWRVTLSGPMVFTGSSTQMARALAAKIAPGDEAGSVRRLIQSMNGTGKTVPDAKRFRTNEAAGKIILCSWWNLGPRSPLTAQPYSQQELGDVLAEQMTAALAVGRFFTRGLTGDHQGWAANRLLIPSMEEPVSELPGMLDSRPPEGVRTDDWNTVLTSHCVSSDAARHLEQGDAEAFVQARQLDVERHLDDFLARMAAWDYEDTPPLRSLDLDDEDESELEDGA